MEEGYFARHKEGPQVAQARNIRIGEHRHCCVTSKYKNLYPPGICMGKKPIVSVTYENERISIKEKLA